MGLYDFSFYDLVKRNSSVYRHRSAWMEPERSVSLTFSEYRQKVESAAAGLQKLGVVKGDRIGVLGKNSLEYFMLYGAAAAVGAIVLPVNWRLSEKEVCYNLSDCNPVVVFADGEYQEMIRSNKNRFSSVKHFFGLADTAEDVPSFEEIMTDPATLVPADVSTDDGWVIIHTAAVAGRPRGALLSHGNVICGNIQWANCMNLSRDDVHLNFLPLFHVAGLFMATCGFHAGALNINMEKFDAEQAAGLIEEHRVSYFFDFSPILASLMEAAEKTGKSLASLKAVTGLDSAENIEKFQSTAHGIFYSMYGQTETSSVATYGRYDDCPGSAGQPVPLSEVRVVDENDRPLPPGEVGEIVMKGPMVFRGYWNLSEDTEETLKNGWHHTGDTGRFDEDGFLFFVGRKPEKELIKPGGENVYPAEVEAVILKHPAVSKTVVFGIPDPKWKEAIKAVCQLEEGKTLTAEELIAFVGGRIARYKKPQLVEFVEDLPLAKDGSPDRGEVKKRHGG